MNGLGDSSLTLLKLLEYIIRIAVRILAVLMTLLIILGVIDVGWMLFEKAWSSSPKFILSISDILATFGAFLAVLIAIEIFVNIVMYLREDIIHVKIVVATALMAISRKVIIMDFAETSAAYIWATAGVILATSIAYWLVDNSKLIQVEEGTAPGPQSQTASSPTTSPSAVTAEGKPEMNKGD